MSSVISIENPQKNNSFWNNATKYAACSKADEGFVSEIAYVMVTLHRTGA